MSKPNPFDDLDRLLANGQDGGIEAPAIPPGSPVSRVSPPPRVVGGPVGAPITPSSRDLLSKSLGDFSDVIGATAKPTSVTPVAPALDVKRSATSGIVWEEVADDAQAIGALKTVDGKTYRMVTSPIAYNTAGGFITPEASKAYQTQEEQMSTLEDYRALNKLLPNVSPYVARATNVNTRAALVQAGRASTAADRDQAILSAASSAQSDLDIQVVLAAMDNFPTESPSAMRTEYLADTRMSEQARKAMEEYMVPKVRREKIGMLVNAGLLPSDYEARLNRARGARDAFRRGAGRDDPTLAYEFETLFNRPEAVARNFTGWEKRKREINAELDTDWGLTGRDPFTYVDYE